MSSISAGWATKKRDGLWDNKKRRSIQAKLKATCCRCSVVYIFNQHFINAVQLSADLSCFILAKDFFFAREDKNQHYHRGWTCLSRQSSWSQKKKQPRRQTRGNDKGKGLCYLNKLDFPFQVRDFWAKQVELDFGEKVIHLRWIRNFLLKQ